MASNTDALVLNRVIGDVVDMFVPTTNMYVYYSSKHVTNGGEIKPSMAATAPRVTITGQANDLYTLVMTDPDAPSPSEPSMREWVHWIVTDIPGCTNVNQGKEVLAYMSPRPLLGIHRYVLILFHQKNTLGFLEPPALSSHFNTRLFARTLDLGVPVATVYFNARKEPTSRRSK